jgi:hypothetical protein
MAREKSTGNDSTTHNPKSETETTIQTNLMGDGPVYFTDPQAAAMKGRYYRAVLLQ